MKKNCWSLFGMMVATTLLAQPASTPPPAPIATPAAAPLATNVSAAAPANTATNAPAKKKKAAPKKSAPKKPAAAELKTVPLVPGPAVVDATHVNVRGQARLKSEVVARLNKGDAVTVLEEIVHNNSAADEPSAWAKILLPTNAHAFVNSAFIEPTNQTVKPKKLNVRSGAGENYSVIALLLHGDSVKQRGTKGDWLEIEPPTNSYAFVAAQFLKQEPAGTTPTEPMPAPTAVAEAPAIAAAPTETPAVPPPTEAATNAPPEIAAAANAPTETAAPAVEEPPPKRIVMREGLVRGTVSIQAPTKFGLYSVDNGRLIDYIYTSSPNLDLRRYKGLRIVITGEEALEERWGNTPVITIQKIQVLEEGP